MTARVKLEKDCAALRRLLEERTAEWDREKRRLNDHLAKLTGQRAGVIWIGREEMSGAGTTHPELLKKAPQKYALSKIKIWLLEKQFSRNWEKHIYTYP